MGTHVCPWWLTYTFDNPFRRLFHDPEKIFYPYIEKGMTVADIGCGFGYFAIGLAKLTGKQGKVIAADLQTKMLEKAEQRARKAGVADLIRFHKCRADHIDIDEPLDFALAFWVAHETPDVKNFFTQIYQIVRPGGLLLLAEPRIHVSGADFQNEITGAKEVGFAVKAKPLVRLSHCVLLAKGQEASEEGRLP